MIRAGYGKCYVCQTYPIQLKKCKDEDDAIDEINKYWTINHGVKIKI